MSNNIISSISYTDKDFNSIYEELLDLAKKLTNKWDPSLSNESDPGVILLKLNAIIADKNNYNIDKNVLECFPSSVTQEGNARKLYDLLGYKMGWYKSATTKVSILLKDKSILNGANPIELPVFTQIQDDNKEINYVTLSKAVLYEQNFKTPVTIDVMQGTLKYYEINGSKDIAISNLDDDLRIYLNDVNVAENGIFIKGINDSNWFQWESTNNLVSHDGNAYVYEFGVLPNSKTCYIQFPKDVASLVLDGFLNIAYVISDGLSGNIKSDVLSTFMNNIEYETGDGKVVINDKIRIIQTTGSNDGANPESLEDAFDNYKKTVGTFKTLVTLRDYINYIYNIKVDNQYYLSNVVVSDRASDVNASAWVQTWSPTMEKKDLIVRKSDADSTQDVLTAFDLCLYVLGKGIGTNIADLNTYLNTFKTTTSSDVITTKYIIQNQLSDIKSIQHNLLVSSDLYGSGSGYPINSDSSLPFKTIFNNLAKLKGNIITYSKLTAQEIADVQSNIKLALWSNYNSRVVNFGEQLDYTKLIEVIKKSDNRIQNVALDIPTYDIRRQNVGNNEYELMTQEEKVDLIAKMVLAGNIQLYNIEDKFNLDFGQVDSNTPSIVVGDSSKSVISKITTETLIPVTTDVTTVRANEVIQLYAPNFITTKQYTTYVKYKLNSQLTQIEQDIVVNDSSSILKSGSQILTGSVINGITLSGTESITTERVLSSGDLIKTGSKLSVGSIVNGKVYYNSLPKGVNYKLGLSETLNLQYTDSNGITQVATLGAGTIINSNIELNNKPTIATTNEGFNILQSGEQIDIKEPNISVLSKDTNFYMVLNNDLTLNKSDYYVLQENEYLIYTDSSTTELVLLGSGTLIRNKSDNIFEWAVKSTQLSDLDNIDSGNLENITWGVLNTDLNVEELEIYTLSEGASIKVGSGSYVLSNTAQKLDTSLITITSNGETIVLQPYSSIETDDSVDYWYATSKLNLNTTPDFPQKLEDGQVVKLYFYNETLGTSYNWPNSTEEHYILCVNSNSLATLPNIEWNGYNAVYNVSNLFTTNDLVVNDYISFNSILVMSGGANLNAQVLNTYGEYNYSLESYAYNVSDGYTSTRSVDGNLILTSLNFKTEDIGVYKPIELPFTFDSNKKYVVPVSVNIATIGAQSGRKVVSITDGGGNALIDMDSNALTSITENGVYYISISGREVNSVVINVYNYGTTTGIIPSTSDSITIGKISLIKSFNSEEIGDDSITEDLIVGRIEEILETYRSIISSYVVKFNWVYKVPDADKVLNPLSADSFWNINHIYNKITLPQIDFSKYELNVVN